MLHLRNSGNQLSIPYSKPKLGVLISISPHRWCCFKRKRPRCFLDHIFPRHVIGLPSTKPLPLLAMTHNPPRDKPSSERAIPCQLVRASKGIGRDSACRSHQRVRPARSADESATGETPPLHGRRGNERPDWRSSPPCSPSLEKDGGRAVRAVAGRHADAELAHGSEAKFIAHHGDV